MPSRSLALLLLVLVLGLALRVYALNQAPPGLFYDEAANGIDALDVLAGQHPIFFVGNQGREPLQIYLVALATALVGPGWLAIRLPSLVAGLAAIPATFLLGREVGGQRLGLLSALLLATSYWHLSLSRLGFRAVWLPLAVALALAWLLRGLRNDRPLYLALAGIAMGAAVYTYIAARVLPLALLAIVLWWVAHRRGFHPPRLLLPFAAAAAVAAPLGVYFLQHPDLFWERVENAGGGSASTLARLASAAGVFVWAGDVQARHNLPERPAFEPIAAALFLLGLGLCLRWLRDVRPFALVATTATMLLPQVLATGEPHFLRAAGALPTAQVVAALGLEHVLVRVARPWVRRGLVGALAILWLGATARDYFGVWAPSRAAYEAFDGAGREAVAFLNASTVSLPHPPRRGESLPPLGERAPPGTRSRVAWAGQACPERSRRGEGVPTAPPERSAPSPWTPVATLPAQPPLAAGSPIYAGRATYFLGAPRPPRAAFDSGHALVLPGDDALVLIPSAPSPPEAIRERLGSPLESLGRWRDDSGRAAVTVYQPTAAAMSVQRRVPAVFGGLVGFDGYEIGQVVRPGEAPRALLSWRVLGPAPPGLFQFAHVIGPGQSAETAWAKDDAEAYPSRMWRGGERVLSWFDLALPPDAPLGAYWIATGFYETPSLRRLPAQDDLGRPAGDRLLLGPFKLWDERQAVVRPATALARFDGDLLLVSADVPPAAAPGARVPLRFAWWAGGASAQPLTVFLHVLDDQDHVLAGADGPPAAGTNPTDLWQPGESIVDQRTVQLPADLPPGVYRVEIGLYEATTGRRLPLLAAGERIGDGAVVGKIEVR